MARNSISGPESLTGVQDSAHTLNIWLPVVGFLVTLAVQPQVPVVSAGL